eukprot:jgi/Mesvir1/21451/Mv03912-RA.2
MGVPAFFRWLSDKYPMIIHDVVEATPVQVDGVEIPVDLTTPNPNGIEYDNLYLDMNGIIHPCFHPEDRPAPTTLDEVFKNIFEYIDRLIGIVRPRKLLYMAIDGVAPRAKMNQQRSRRFRAAQDAEEAAKEEARLRQEFENQGLLIPPKKASEAFDSNVITPGSPFMATLAVALQYYIHLRLNQNPGWRNLKVILSDANVPGEGEHKIVKYIRQQRNLPGFDPNTRHCLYGLDADLIMLALATHEAHFSILREVVFTGSKEGKCFICGKEGHMAAECTGETTAEEREAEDKESIAKKPYQFLHVWILREYLTLDLRVFFADGTPADPERLLDDWVFMCFFVGNDFLPHMPTLEIREGAIDLLVHIYKNNFAQLGGYLSENGVVDRGRVEKFMTAVGLHEDAIFQKRARMHARQKERALSQKANGGRGGGGFRGRGRGGGYDSNNSINVNGAGRGSQMMMAAAMAKVAVTAVPVKRFEGSRLASGPSRTVEVSVATLEDKKAGGDNKRAAQALKATLLARHTRPETEEEVTVQVEGVAVIAPADKRLRVDEAGTSVPSKSLADEEESNAAKNEEAAAEFLRKLKDTLKEKGDMLTKEEEDKVRLGDVGWKERYYQEKFGTTDAEVRKHVVFKYIEGLCWVLQYYYQGCTSWDWYFPYHYAPFASDLVGLEDMVIELPKGEPFKPFSQLMGVLPAASAHCLPLAYRPLMCDPKSPIIDFYPLDFKVDMNGKRFAWQGVALLPFIDEVRLLAAIEMVEHTLTEEEKRRNSRLSNLLFVHCSHPLAPYIYALYDKFEDVEDPAERAKASQPMDPKASGGMNGLMYLCAGDQCPQVLRSPIASLPDIVGNKALAIAYKDPADHPHIARLPEGAIPPEPRVTEQDLPEPAPLWHEDRGGGRGRGRGSGRGSPIGSPGSPMHGRSPPPSLSDAALRFIQQGIHSVQRPGMPAQGRQSYPPGFQPPPMPAYGQPGMYNMTPQQVGPPVIGGGYPGYGGYQQQPMQPGFYQNVVQGSYRGGGPQVPQRPGYGAGNAGNGFYGGQGRGGNAYPGANNNSFAALSRGQQPNPRGGRGGQGGRGGGYY